VQLNLFRIAYPVTSLGPGNRVVIWVAGCRKCCKGCISPEMQDPKAGTMIDTVVLASHLFKLTHSIEGITISGGEPFDQAEALSELLHIIKFYKPEWNILVYTGYLLAAVRKKEFCYSLLDMTDVLIDGLFRKDIPSRHPLSGSGNQRVTFMSERAKLMRAAFDGCTQGAVSLGISSESCDMLIGVIDEKHRSKIHDSLKTKC
jgi:anaerobic ribonucleoside-triphosphate reductase activating protein